MSKIKVWTWFFVTLCCFAVISGWLLLVVRSEWKSERSKRIELEAELKSVATDYLEVGEFIGVDPRAISLLRRKYNIPDPDSLLAVPPKDSIKLNTFDWATGDSLGTRWFKIKSIDSSEVTE